MDVRLQALQEATASLRYLADTDWAKLGTQLDPRLIDGLKNGLAQKFEYTLELCWKCIKDYLRAQEGIDEAAPKRVLKAYYLAGHLTEEAYLQFMAAVDDRNRLAHVYDEATFKGILDRIPSYSLLIEATLQTLAGGRA